MKKKLLLLTSLISSVIVFSQQAKVWIPYRDGDRWGYSDTLGKITVKPSYDSVDLFGTLGYVYKADKVGVINSSGLEIIKPVYTYIESFAGGFLVKAGDKVGYMSGQGKMILAVEYDELYNYMHEFIVVMKGKKYGVALLTGKIVLPVQYDDVNVDFDTPDADPETNFLARQGEKYFLFNKKTYKLTAFKGVVEDRQEGILEAISDITPSESPNIENLRLEAIKKLGLDSAVYYPGPRFYEEDVFFLATKNGKKGVVQYFSATDIKTVVPIEYDAVSYIKTNSSSSFVKPASTILAAVSKNGKYGIVNETGAVIIPFEYDGIGELENYSFGFELQQGSKKGVYLPTTSYPLISPKYDAIEYAGSVFVNSNWEFALYEVTINGKKGYVGENGVEFFK